MEEFVRGVLQEILDLDEETVEGLSVDSDLIEFGLDSLKAIELVVHIEDNYDIIILDDDLLIDNISTIEKIMDMIKRYIED